MGGNSSSQRQFKVRKSTTLVKSYDRTFFFAAACIALSFLSAAVASALPLSGAISTGERLLGDANAIVNVRVVCEERREGDKIRTFYCPDGNTCINDGGIWKCRSAQAQPQAPQTPRSGPMQTCAECDVQRSRCFTGCDNNPNLQLQAQCVNRCNAAYPCIMGSDCR